MGRVLLNGNKNGIKLLAKNKITKGETISLYQNTRNNPFQLPILPLR